MEIETQIRQLREADRIVEFKEALLICTGYMSLPLYLVFWIADLIYVPHLKWEFLYLRLLIIPCSVIIFKTLHLVAGISHIQLLALAFTAANAWPITAMVFLAEGASSPYYAGLNLVALGILSFMPWQRRFLPAVGLVIFGPYYTFAAFSPSFFQDIKMVSIYSFFIIGTIVASFIARYFYERLRYSEIANRIKLANEVQDRERIILAKTQEAYQLQRLSRQFSPQVVNAISSGKITLKSESQRANICVVFIDIVNSTDRVTRIDKDDLNKALTMFIEDTAEILLKYDITIDKFLGDGLLAFSNAPLQRPDFIQRTVLAALDIRERIVSRRTDYISYWRNEMQIRVGIASGFANVGFYGSDSTFKTYTAIGRVVNLASRICGAAQPNQILVSSDVVRGIDLDEIEISEGSLRKLKGFEEDILQLHTVDRRGAISSDVESCPAGHGLLKLSVNANGIYILSCAECGYVQQSALKKAKLVA